MRCSRTAPGRCWPHRRLKTPESVHILHLSNPRRRATVFGALLFCWLSVSASSVSADDRLNELRSYLAGLTTLEADFEQQVLDSDGEVLELASGTVTLKKPGRFRWNYSQPYERVVVADGERVWIYESDLQQVTVRRLTSGLGETPAALLTGDTKALDQFEYVTSFSADGRDWITLRPRAADTDFSGISLAFRDDLLDALEFQDRLGQRTRLSLTNVARDREIGNAEFEFIVPDDADVIGETEL